MRRQQVSQDDLGASVGGKVSQHPQTVVQSLALLGKDPVTQPRRQRRVTDEDRLEFGHLAGVNGAVQRRVADGGPNALEPIAGLLPFREDRGGGQTMAQLERILHAHRIDGQIVDVHPEQMREGQWGRGRTPGPLAIDRETPVLERAQEWLVVVAEVLLQRVASRIAVEQDEVRARTRSF